MLEPNISKVEVSEAAKVPRSGWAGTVLVISIACSLVVAFCINVYDPGAAISGAQSRGGARSAPSREVVSREAPLLAYSGAPTAPNPRPDLAGSILNAQSDDDKVRLIRKLSLVDARKLKPLLLDTLRGDGSAQVRREAIQKLTWIAKNEETTEWLVSALSMRYRTEPDLNVRNIIVIAFGDLFAFHRTDGYQSAMRALSEAMYTEYDPAVRLSAVAQYAILQEPTLALSVLREVLIHERDPLVIERVVTEIEYIQSNLEDLTRQYARD